MTIYVTETFRFLGRMGVMRSFEGVQAYVSDTPCGSSPERFYSPGEWQALLRQPDVLYRYKKEPYQIPYTP